jgi:PKHD-type hydroxylase
MTGPVLENAFIKWEDAFTPQELDHIEAYGDKMIHQKAVIAQPTDNDDAVRITQIAWLEYAPEIKAFYDKMAAVVQHLNQNFYKFDITGLENFQYTVYHADQRGHYDWHIDFGAKNPRPRKISISLQLSNDDAYEGCDLQFQPGNKIGTAPRKRGTLVAFPSFFLHRVTPITAGTRKSLVCWVAGPAFR